MPGARALYFDQMLRPNKQIVRAVLLGLMLIVGSVQAQVTYYCSMMESIIPDDCCCADVDADDMLVVEIEPCCDQSVELGIDTTSDQAQSTAKPVKFDSDVDPPDSLAFGLVLSLPSLAAALMPGINQADAIHTAGSSTYLITQRLRI